MTPFIQDADFTLYVGDVREVLAGLEDGSVDCVVTSPPYWGLRDYGTGLWVGGDEDCDHKAEPKPARKFTNGRGEGVGDDYAGSNLTSWTYRDATPVDGCPKGCGATRQDQQLGLEPTPGQYVENMVAVFREVRRVLADHGTCWVNLGDSYNNRNMTRKSSHQGGLGFESADLSKSWSELKAEGRTRMSIEDGVMKEKDLCGIPWKVAFALQADGWYLRSDIIWSKPNPMPESVTDRPTKAHEYVFLLSKRPRYWFDAEAVREPAAPSVIARADYAVGGTKHVAERNDNGRAQERRYSDYVGGRNVRSVWDIATQPYPEAHFATYPEELVRRCLLAGCPEWVCRVCGRPRERIVERRYLSEATYTPEGESKRYENGRGRNVARMGDGVDAQTVGWSDCGHNNYRRGVVLDPFLGSGTTAQVARRHGRHTIGIELNPTYAELAARRLQQLSLLT